jgi:hypothetical protein
MMKKYLLVTCITLFAFITNKLASGWVHIEQTTINNEKLDIYFFDYLSKLEKVQPDFIQYKGRAFTDVLKNVQFQFPAYVAKRSVHEDSVIYYILRPNIKKADNPYFYDLEIVKTGKDFPIEDLEDQALYKEHIVKLIDTVRCRGALISEYNFIIQNNPDKDKLIGNGIQIADSIYVRVLPYKEVKGAFYKLIEVNL